MGRVAAIWCMLLLATPFAWLWLRTDLAAGAGLLVAEKLLVIIAVVGAAALLFLWSAQRAWSAGTSRLERFVTALPAIEASLPDNEPLELQSLYRAMRAMAERVRQVVERTNSEVRRRETILACMAEGVLAVDRNLKVIFCNDAFAVTFGARPPVEGRILYEVVREPLLREILERVVESGPAETDRFQLPSASGRWFEARALPLTEQSQRGAVIVLHDVTDITRQERMRKDFVADVSHELRTPLAAIRGYAETLLDGGLEDRDNNRKFVEIILSHATRLSNIASDLLVISELDSNVPPPTAPEPVPVRDVIESAVNTVATAAAIRGVRVLFNQPESCAVLGYRFRLEQAVVNLLDNAVKFNREGGEVSIDCGVAEDGQIRISVSDTGIGIPSEDLKRVFERFYRVDKARSRPAGGTGLGLPIVKEVVERMGGTVLVESQLGRGSKFTLLLKAA